MGFRANMNFDPKTYYSTTSFTITHNHDNHDYVFFKWAFFPPPKHKTLPPSTYRGDESLAQ